jgi:type IV pilus assembly protein PilB
MAVTPQTLYREIENSGLVDKSDLKLASTTSTHLGCSLSTVLLGRGLITSKNLGDMLAKLYRVPFIDLDSLPLTATDVMVVPETIAVERHCIVFKKEGTLVHLAMEEPGDLDTQEMIRKSIGSGIRLKVYITTEEAIKKALKVYGSHSKPQLQVQSSGASAIEVIDTVLEAAVRDEVSDIHLEPLEKEVLIRFRVDGVLIDHLVLAKVMHNSLIARIKILAELKIDEHRLPQDGQFAYQSKRGTKNSFRVSIVPTVYGEKIVLRLLEDSLNKFTLDELGLLPEDQEIIEHTLKKTHGMFLLTGPTGSGKTTSLYTMLGILNQPQVNIVTIEDPVENRLTPG